jgi:microcystin-dependent protein
MSTTQSRKKQQTNNTMVFLQNRTADFMANPTKTLDVIVKRDETVMGNLTVGNDLRANNFYASGNYYLDNYVLVPPGTIIMSAAINIPDGWLECNGDLLNISDYPALHAAIDYQFSIDGQFQEEYTFHLPNLKGKCVIGAGQGSVNGIPLTNRAFSETGGEETHTLTTGEMPSHNHESNANGGSIGLAFKDGYGTPGSIDNSEGELNNTGSLPALSITNSGGGGAHNNMQPYIALRYLIKY